MCLQRQDMRNKEVCVNVPVWMCDVTGQLCIMTHKDPILTHEDRHTHTHTQWTRPADATVTVTERIHLSVVIRLRCVADNAAHSPPQMYPDIDG